MRVLGDQPTLWESLLPREALVIRPSWSGSIGG